MPLEEALAKIKSPNLESQQHTAVVLLSIEDTLKDQNAKFTPTAYFAALLALIKQATAAGNLSNNNELIASAVYLLDTVTSYVPHALLRAQYSKITTVLGPVLLRPESDAPLLRSTLGCLESLLLAQDSAAWSLPLSQQGPRQAVAAILALAVDPRPKIRKRAQEILVNVLEHPPPGPALDHPAAELCAVSVLNNLKTAVDIASKAKRQRGHTDTSHEPAVIHALQLTKTIATASRGWPSKKVEPLCDLLLSISRSRNEFLVLSAFEVFEVIFEGLSDEISSTKLPRLLEAIIDLKPAQNDVQILPPWLAVLSRGYGVSGQVESGETFAKLPELVDLVANYLTSQSHHVRVSASECLVSFFANCVPASVILEPSIYDEKVLQQLADQANGLLAVKYQSAWMEVFTTISALFDALRWRGDPFMLPIVKAIGELRGSNVFQGKKEADEVLGSAIRNLGPQAVLSVLPHNLTKPQVGEPGRAWLLPLLRDHVSNTNLSHFKSELVPLSEAMYERVLNHGDTEKTMETKIFETVVQQVWATLPGYCDLPLDLQVSLDQSFAELISNLLYKQTQLRVDLCRGLQNLVESNQAILASDLSNEDLQLERRTSRVQAEQNLQHLANFASNLLAVLFNVYSQTLPQSRTYILQCINAYLSITPEKDLIDTFDRVSKMLESSLPNPNDSSQQQKQQQPKNSLPPISHTLLDLIVALSIHLPRSSFAALFALSSRILNSSTLSKSDPQLTKKAYKIIPRLATSPTGAAALHDRAADLQSLILATTDKTPVPARRDRLLAINTILSSLPTSDLHFIPSILSEVVLACKDSNEKARTAGFDVLIAIAKKISDPSNPAGTVIRNSLVSHMSDNAPDAPAQIEEVFTMVSAGLAGVAPHMVAASITALARLLFEFHDTVDEGVKKEVVDTVSMFLQSNNREIVRSVLGFVKVVVVLPWDDVDLESRMKETTPALMVWSRENKGRLRVKVRGILDRCVRRFGAEKVESWVQGKEEKKMVANIRKRRERARRKKKAGGEDEDENSSEAEAPKKTFDNEFDEAVYGSGEDDDSEIEGGSDDEETMSGVSLRPKSKREDQFIRQDDEDDEPLDLLDPKSQSSITSKKAVRFGRAEKKRKARVNEDGKLIFGGHEDDDVLMDNTDGDAGAVDAYVDAVDGPDAVRRGQKGRLKVKSSGRRGETMEMDLDPEQAREVAKKIMGAARQGSASPRIDKSKRPQDARKALGAEKSRQKQFGSGKGRVGKKVKFQAGGGVGRRHGGYGGKRR